EPVVAAAPPKRSTPLGAVVGAIIVVLIVVVVGYSYVANRDAVPSGTSAFVNGHGVPFSAADGTFSVEMPPQPTADQRPISVNGLSANLTAATVETDSYEMGAASFVLPAPIPQNAVTTTLESAMKAGVANVDGKVLHENNITRGGVPALEATFK